MMQLTPNNIDLLWKAKQYGFTDAQLAHIWKMSELEVRRLRTEAGVLPVFKLVDTCAAEFEAYTPYYYSCYERPPLLLPGGTHSIASTCHQTRQSGSLHEETHSITSSPPKPTPDSEVRKSGKPTIMILGGGANRIGQGIEFDYCCCHAAYALRAAGFDTVMVNSNPETVSTDYDTSTRLYFEPLTFENILNIVEVEQPIGVIVQFGGQTPLNLALRLEAAGVPILGTSPESIDKTEDRKFFGNFLNELGIRQPEGGTATNYEEAVVVARRVGFPVLVRPSFVLGGRAMEIVYDEDSLKRYVARAVEASPDRPILIDRFLDDAIEVDVDAVCDGNLCVIGGIMEHIEQAGIHSGDSACVLPPRSLSPRILDEIRTNTQKIALSLGVRGLMNVQYAVQPCSEDPEGRVYVLEVNPRASRTVPFVSKAIGVGLARIAALVMAGKSLEELGLTDEPQTSYYSVKEAVLPFVKFRNVDPLLGPEMRSTGEVMGISTDFAVAFAKAQTAAGNGLPYPPKPGEVKRAFLSVNDRHKAALLPIAQALAAMGFQLVATQGTCAVLEQHGIKAQSVFKVHEGRPNITDRIKSQEIHLVINTPLGAASQEDERSIRRAVIEGGLPYATTIHAARTMVEAIGHLESELIYQVRSLQDWQKLNRGI